MGTLGRDRAKSRRNWWWNLISWKNRRLWSDLISQKGATFWMVKKLFGSQTFDAAARAVHMPVGDTAQSVQLATCNSSCHWLYIANNPHVDFEYLVAISLIAYWHEQKTVRLGSVVTPWWSSHVYITYHIISYCLYKGSQSFVFSCLYFALHIINTANLNKNAIYPHLILHSFQIAYIFFILVSYKILFVLGKKRYWNKLRKINH